jgi:hypothetical protein
VTPTNRSAPTLSARTIAHGPNEGWRKSLIKLLMIAALFMYVLSVNIDLFVWVCVFSVTGDAQRTVFVHVARHLGRHQYEDI